MLSVEGEAETESDGDIFNEMMMPPQRLDLSDEASTIFSRQHVRKRMNDLFKNMTVSEISGSLGDLGTFIPLYVALCRKGSLYPTAALFFAGLSNVLTGIVWDLPMPVQPMKAIAAVALVEGLSQEQVTTAGVWMALFLFLLGFTNAIEMINRVVPKPVVWGMQLGVGANLAIKGLVMVSQLTWFETIDCIVLAIACALMCAILLAESVEATPNNHPVGVYMFLLGSILAVVQLLSESNDAPSSALSQTRIVERALRYVTWKDWKVGLLQGALPQLPLSTFNSVISVCCLADSLFPDRRSEEHSVLSRQQVCVSVGLMNLLVLLGAMPNCHGAGGLAGQYKFGARHGSSVVFLGSCKVLLAVLFGKYILTFLEHIPSAILGVMLVISGQELASAGLTSLFVPLSRVGDSNNVGGTSRSSLEIALITAIIIIGLKKTHVGALVGILLDVLQKFRQTRLQSAVSSSGNAPAYYDPVQTSS